ncbi:MAG: hypothetical protein NTW93_02465 [Phycisphaerae bacterium]|nr:hypothetical protein [Phycisphaerae bacterium]
MEKDSYDSHVDRGIAECNQDISKAAEQENISPQSQKLKSASRVMPACEDILKNKAIQSSTLHSLGDGVSHPPVQSADEKEFVRKMVEKISHPQQQDRSSQIPSLDLGTQILAQQRKIAALKRKSPLSNNNLSVNKEQVRPFDLAQGRQVQPKALQVSPMPPTPASPQQRIIADIVAKEILILSSAR